MKLSLKPGVYVAAVSGGVDSMVLLDLLTKQKDLKVIVAHFDHGIREDSHADARLVKDAAAKYGLEFETQRIELGAGASEEKARRARYGFLEKIKDKHRAAAIITAHHQDDVIETAFLNIIRGTGPRGVVSIYSPMIKRPLLKVTKEQLKKYAEKNHLRWREDTTNVQDFYLRNYIRKHVVPQLSENDRAEMLKNIEKIAKNKRFYNFQIENILQKIKTENGIDRVKFINLPAEIASEVMADWLRTEGVEIDRKLVERMMIFTKTAHPGTIHNVKGNVKLCISARDASLSKG